MVHLLLFVKAQTPEELHNRLAPYHQFECTGVDDEYVQNMDITDEFKQDLANSNGDLRTVASWYGLIS